MKQMLMQNRLFLVGTVAALSVVTVLAISGKNSSAALTSGAEEGVLAQVETILATSARHVFDEDYWIANMHSIRTSNF